jgi:hypothetical protein
MAPVFFETFSDSQRNRIWESIPERIYEALRVTIPKVQSANSVGCT